MNKYEMRAEAVLKKKEEYLKKRENKMRIAVTFFATAACIAAIVGVAAAFYGKHGGILLFSPIVLGRNANTHNREQEIFSTGFFVICGYTEFGRKMANVISGHCRTGMR